MTTNRIPLFRIPFLALCIILDLYSLHDIIQLSLCSKKSIRVAKQCWKKRGKIRAELHVTRAPCLLLYYNEQLSYKFDISETRYLEQKTHNIRIGKAVLPSLHKENETVTYWDDKIFGIKQIVPYIKDLFDVPITSINLEVEEYHNEFIRIMDFIRNTQGTVTNCTLNTVDPIEECLAHLLDNCKITGSFRIDGELSTLFRNNWNIHMDHLQITNGHCLTSQNLMNMDCQFLKVRRSNLTSEDANQFLKNWQNGGNPRLTFLSIEIQSIDQGTITLGMNAVSQRLNRYYRYLSNRKIYKFGGLDIRRNDGTTGTIFLYNDNFQFGVDLREDRP